MDNLRSLLEHGGFRTQSPATPSGLAELEIALGIRLPTELGDLWSYSDGTTGGGIEILSVARAREYTPIFDWGFGYIPFTESNDSNPYCVCSRDPLCGAVVHVFHDQEPILVCRSLGRFLELVALARQNGADVAQIEGDFQLDRPERASEDVAIARKLLTAAGNTLPGDRTREDGLRFAAQLFGPGQEAELGEVLALGDEYTREAVQRRWKGLNTRQAQGQLDMDSAAYREFINMFRRSFERAGIRTESHGDGEFVLLPGRVHLNFRALFVDCRRPGAIDEWVERLRSRLGQSG